VPEPFGPILQAKRAEFNDPLADSIPAHVTLLGPTVVHHVARPALVEHLARVASEVGAFRWPLRGTGTFRPVSDVVFVQVALGISGCERLEQRIRTGPYAADLTFPYHRMSPLPTTSPRPTWTGHSTILPTSGRLRGGRDLAVRAGPTRAVAAGPVVPPDRARADPMTAPGSAASPEPGGIPGAAGTPRGPDTPWWRRVWSRVWSWVTRTRVWRARERYSMARGDLLAAGIAYFSFFSLFPALGVGCRGLRLCAAGPT
jgi:hypothetical protein